MGQYTPEQMREYMARRRSRIRAELTAMLGGHCVRCSSTGELEFDHKDPATKHFAIASGLDKPRSVLLAEVAKCQLLCRPHHLEKTRGEAGTRRGEANSNAKLTEAEAVAILNTQGQPATVVAERYGVSDNTVHDIRKGRRWSHLTCQVTQVVNESAL